MAVGDRTDPFRWKQNDTRPRLQYTITQGVPNLTGASAVFSMRVVTGNNDSPGAVKISRVAATVASAIDRVLQFTPTATHTDTVGLYQGEFEVTLADGGVMTVPSGSDYIWIQVGDDVA